MFTKAIVLSDTNFRTLVDDFIDEFMDDYSDEVESGEMTEEGVRSYFALLFEEMLNVEDVDEMVAFLGEAGAVEIANRDDFVRHVMDHFGVENLLSLVSG
jgi:uncharacterized protein CbrC (UPF0167 family)